MGLVDRDDGWLIPDWLWAKMEPLLPPRTRPRTRSAATAPGAGQKRDERHPPGIAHGHAVERPGRQRPSPRRRLSVRRPAAVTMGREAAEASRPIVHSSTARLRRRHTSSAMTMTTAAAATAMR